MSNVKTALDEQVLKDPGSLVKEATKSTEFKLLDRDERKEMEKLKELLTPMTPFQIRFIEQYVRTASAAESARIAGSKSNQPETVGYKMLQDPRIQQAIAICMKKRIEAVGLDTIEVIMKIRRVYDEALAAGKYDAANKACELLQREIERASKAPGNNANLTGPGKSLLIKGNPDEETSVTDIEQVLSIISSKEPRAAGV